MVVANDKCRFTFLIKKTIFLNKFIINFLAILRLFKKINILSETKI
jgi:hypothetical protein